MEAFERHDGMSGGGSGITTVLQQHRDGDAEALHRVIDVCHRELKGLAASLLRGERPHHTLQPTALVNEAVLRLLDGRPDTWSSRADFFAAVAREMRRALTDAARRRLAAKRGGGSMPVSSDVDLLPSPRLDLESLIALDQALDRLATAFPRSAAVVELRHIVGLSTAEVAALLDTTTRTVERDWAWGRAQLYGELKDLAR